MMYRFVFTCLEVSFPLDAFFVGVQNRLFIPPGQLHPNSWELLVAFKKFWEACFFHLMPSSIAKSCSSYLFLHLFAASHCVQEGSWVKTGWTIFNPTSDLTIFLLEEFDNGFKHEFLKVSSRGSFGEVPLTFTGWADKSLDPSSSIVSGTELSDVDRSMLRALMEWAPEHPVYVASLIQTDVVVLNDCLGNGLDFLWITLTSDFSCY
ncbi:MAG: hypothetical protein Q8877_03045 [Sweet potato little leaf phytoplasma]|nr:hypothetical protein [Sweet potato little leaf phytoplasma]